MSGSPHLLRAFLDHDCPQLCIFEALGLFVFWRACIVMVRMHCCDAPPRLGMTSVLSGQRLLTTNTTTNTTNERCKPRMAHATPCYPKYGSACPQLWLPYCLLGVAGIMVVAWRSSGVSTSHGRTNSVPPGSLCLVADHAPFNPLKYAFWIPVFVAEHDVSADDGDDEEHGL